jgi:hypothetical protein
MASDWPAAKNAFEKLMEQYSDVGLYSIYFKRISEYDTSPPPCDWDHAQRLASK